MRRLDCHDAIKQVKTDHDTALETVNLVVKLVVEQPKYLDDHHLSLPELRSLAQGLHDLYFVRMFACFESSLRHYWRTEIKDSKPSTKQLLSSIAGRHSVPQDVLDRVHEIRDFRNYLIHEEHEVRMRFTIKQASGYLNEYLSRLPREW